MFYRFARGFLVAVMKPFFRYEITGRENIPKTGSVILTANHMSYLDPVMIAIASPREVNFMAKASLLKIPGFGQLIKALNAFPVKRGIADKAAIMHSLKVLSEDKVLLIFPEGTRIRNGELGEPLPGVASIALKTGASIVPIGIIGTDKVAPDGTRMPRFVKLKARIGQPIVVEKAAAAERKEKEAELTAKMMDEIRKLVKGE